MRIGIDVDGVLADFVNGFCDLAERKLGKVVGRTPDRWEWADDYLTQEEQAELWKHIKANPYWWGTLKPIDTTGGSRRILDRWANLRYDIYAITTRVGDGALYSTMDWLIEEFFPIPVIITRNAIDKAKVAEALRLTHFVDDNADNCRAVMERWPEAKTCLFAASHNLSAADFKRIHRLEELI